MRMQVHTCVKVSCMKNHCHMVVLFEGTFSLKGLFGLLFKSGISNPATATPNSNACLKFLVILTPLISWFRCV